MVANWQVEEALASWKDEELEDLINLKPLGGGASFRLFVGSG